MTASDTLLFLSLPDAERITLHPRGAHVLQWQDASGKPLLYLSPLTLAAGAPWRGGVPVCFPQFSNRGSLPKHGFARVSDWVAVPGADANTMHLRLQDSPATQALWPHRFVLDLQVRLAPKELAITLRAHNPGGAPWTFTGALHTYLQVDDIAATQLDGLQGLHYEDALDDCRLKAADEARPDLSRPIDRVYRQVRGPLTVRTATHLLELSQAGFEDAVVWNPGPAGAAALPDLPDADHRVMLCVEAAQASRALTVEPGASWEGSQTLRLLPQ